jgi:DNA-binding beta-propeller fold protein YncE
MSAAAPSQHGRAVLFVANSVAGTVTLVDARTFRVLGALNIIPDGNTPRDPVQASVYPAIVARQGVNYAEGIAVSPDGQTLYVSRGYLGDVAAFQIATGHLLWRLQVSGIRADHVALSPDGRRLFVSALTANQVQVIDTHSHAFVGSFLTGDWPHVLEFSPDGHFVYNGSLGNQLLPTGLDGSKQITVADAQTLSVVRTYPFDAGVRPFVLTPDGRTMFLQLSYFNGFDELDLQTGRIVKTVNLPVSGPGAQMQPKDYPNQAAHHGIALSPDGAYVCDAGTISNYVALVSRPALTVAAIIPVGDQPAEALTSLDGRYCFVTNRGPGRHANSVSVISYAERREIARVAVGEHPMEEEEAIVPDSVLRTAGDLPAGSQTIGTPTRGSHTCTTRRVFTVRFRPRGLRPGSLVVYVAGRRVRRVRGRTSVRVDLRGRSGTVRVVLVGRARRHGHATVRRDIHTYHLCGRARA